MANLLLADLTSGADLLLLDLQQGAQGVPASAGADTLVSIVGPFTGAPTLYATNEVTVTGGLVTLTFPSTINGAWCIIKLLAGDPSVHNLVLAPPGGKNIEGVLGVGVTVPGTYYASLTFNLAGQAGTSIRWYVNSGGNIAVSG